MTVFLCVYNHKHSTLHISSGITADSLLEGTNLFDEMEMSLCPICSHKDRLQAAKSDFVWVRGFGVKKLNLSEASHYDIINYLAVLKSDF